MTKTQGIHHLVGGSTDPSTKLGIPWEWLIWERGEMEHAIFQQRQGVGFSNLTLPQIRNSRGIIYLGALQRTYSDGSIKVQ